MNYIQLWSHHQGSGQKFKRKLDRSSCLEGHHVIDRCTLIDFCLANRVLNELFINGVRTVRVDLLWPYFKHEPRARDNKFCVTHLAWKRKTEEKIKGAICLRRFSFVLTCALDLFSRRAPSVSRPFPLAALAQRGRVSGGRESTGGLRPQHPECVCSWPSHSTHWQTPFFLFVCFLFNTVAACDAFRVAEMEEHRNVRILQEWKGLELINILNEFVLGGYCLQRQASIAFLSTSGQTVTPVLLLHVVCAVL